MLEASSILCCHPSVVAHTRSRLSILKSGACLRAVSSSWLQDALLVLEALPTFLVPLRSFPKLEERGPCSSPPASSRSQTPAQAGSDAAPSCLLLLAAATWQIPLRGTWGP